VNQDELASQLSAMFDGELPAAECELLSRRLARDEQLRAVWSRYSVIGAALRAEPVAQVRPDFARRVSAALIANVNVFGRFMVTGAGAQIILTRRVVEANDGTLNIATATGTATGLTDTPTSDNTRAGGSMTPDDISGAVVGSSSYNLVGVNTGLAGISNADAGQNQVGTAATPLDPKLNPLANNGGPTFTHSLQDGSPAIDKGTAFGLTTDQRGFPRPIDLADTNAIGGDASDIGA